MESTLCRVFNQLFDDDVAEFCYDNLAPPDLKVPRLPASIIFFFFYFHVYFHVYFQIASGSALDPKRSPGAIDACTPART